MVETMTDFSTIVAQHEELHALSGELRQFLTAARPEIGAKGYHTWGADLSSRVMTLHDKLFRHFREEEACGFLEQLQQDCPTAIHVLEGLGGDHARILEEFRDLVGAAMAYGEGQEMEDQALRQRTLAVLEELSEHERKETELLQRTYCDDYGYGD